MSTEKHHVLYYRQQWESTPTTRKLRQHPALIVPMHAEIEQDLHSAVTCVPLLDLYTAQHTYKEWHPCKTYIASIHGLLTAIEASARHRKATTVQKRLAELTVYAVETQIPYIREGQLTNEVNGRY